MELQYYFINIILKSSFWFRTYARIKDKCCDEVLQKCWAAALHSKRNLVFELSGISPYSPKSTHKVHHRNHWGLAGGLLLGFIYLFIQFEESLLIYNLAVLVEVLQIVLEEKYVCCSYAYGPWALKHKCWLPAEHVWVMQLLWMWSSTQALHLQKKLHLSKSPITLAFV